MKKSKTRKKLLFLLGSVIFILLGFISIVYLRLFVFDIEERDFDLYNQFKATAVKIEHFKESNGHYPQNLSDIGNERICSKKYMNFCTVMKYRVLADDSGFRMAAKSVSWPIFYYHSDYSKNSIHTNWAVSKNTIGNSEDTFPIYKVTKPIFDKPEEWPDL